MPLRVDKKSLADLLIKRTLGLVDVEAGGIQRRKVHRPREKAFLLDSIARKLPIGALTIYVGEGDMDNETAMWEIIDGKQRMTTVFDYCNGDLIPTGDEIDEMAAIYEDQLPPAPESELADLIRDRRYSDLDQQEKMRLMSYNIPVYLVNGERAEAVRVFARMNHVSYQLKPQELRNAVFRDTTVLNAAGILSLVLNGFDRDDEDLEDSDLIRMRIFGKQKLERMSDVEFASELLYLAFNDGDAMHRRDELDNFYQSLIEPDELNQQKLATAMEKLGDIIPYFKQVFNGNNLKEFNFRSPENDVYALIGAFLKHGFPNTRQRESRRESLQQEISEFFRASTVVVNQIKHDEPISYVDDDDVQEYAHTYLGGQANSNTRRNQRIGCLTRILSRVFDEVDRPFTSYQREIIWATSIDKLCGRCGEIVDYEEYDAGHIVQRAEGGPSTIENGRVEHRHCNRAADD